VIAAVVFDLDGVIVDTEPGWAAVREELTRETGGRWHQSASVEMMGMSSTEWSAYMHDELGVPLAPDEISAEVVRRLAQLYEAGMPLLPGVDRAVTALGAHVPLALASSANRPVIDLVLDRTQLRGSFAVTVSSEEVARGKPAPDVYVAATEGLGTDPRRCAAIEDSTNGIKSAAAAGLHVVAVPNRAVPPADDALARAELVVASLDELDPERVLSLGD
jgi:HAD superfamily hydrolase (TIGR01509 family)